MSISGFFVLIVDETCPITKTEQLSVVLHYIFDGVIYEEFIGYHAAFQLASILQSIDVQKYDAQCYNGASVINRRNVGMQANLCTIVPSAVYIHCHTHCLNMVMVDCVTKGQIGRPTFCFTAETVSFNGSICSSFTF